MKYCCKDFKSALCDGTDCDGYASLFNGYQYTDEDELGWHGGSGLKNLNYCPWCGTKLEPPPKGWQAPDEEKP